MLFNTNGLTNEQKKTNKKTHNNYHLLTSKSAAGKSVFSYESLCYFIQKSFLRFLVIF